MVYMDEIDIQNIGEVVAIVLAKAVKANKINGSQWWELVLLFAAEIDEMK
jgi:hypothetical protein